MLMIIKMQRMGLLSFRYSESSPCCYLQMNCDTPCPQIIDPENTAYHIPSKIIKNKDFPDGISVRVGEMR